jgi:hypothetical protein
MTGRRIVCLYGFVGDSTFNRNTGPGALTGLAPGQGWTFSLSSQADIFPEQRQGHRNS